MEWYSVVVAVLGCIGFGGIISGVILRRLNKMDEHTKEMNMKRVQEDVLIMRGISCVGNLGVATAEAVKTGHANGEVSAAVKDYAEYHSELEKYLMQQSAERNIF